MMRFRIREKDNIIIFRFKSGVSLKINNKRPHTLTLVILNDLNV